jgi:hypothetical protein
MQNSTKAYVRIYKQNMQNEPNGMLFKPYSKPENGDFDNFTKPFYAKRTQWYVIGIQIAMEYDLSKNIKYTKQSQFEN